MTPRRKGAEAEAEIARKQKLAEYEKWFERARRDDFDRIDGIGRPERIKRMKNVARGLRWSERVRALRGEEIDTICKELKGILPPGSLVAAAEGHDAYVFFCSSAGGFGLTPQDFKLTIAIKELNDNTPQQAAADAMAAYWAEGNLK